MSIDVRPGDHSMRLAPASEIDERTTLPMDSWATSSMDLLDGVQIVEHDDAPDAAGDNHKPH